MNPYETLDVAADASDKDIKQAYRSRAQKSHPDREGGDAETFHEITLAYDVLSDPARRSKFDKTGEFGEEPSIQAQAEARIVIMFNQVLDAPGFRGNFIKKATETIRGVTAQLIGEKQKAETELKRLEKISGRVKAKGQNLFETLINQKVRKLQGDIKATDLEQEIIAEALAILKGYEDTAPDAREPAPVRSSLDSLINHSFTRGFNPRK
jgi:DnaJ-class molecular chaperone